MCNKIIELFDIMKTQWFCVFIVLIFTSVVLGKAGPKIVGGVEVEIEDYPYQVSLQRILHICGASVLNENYVVTAAHCTRK